MSTDPSTRQGTRVTFLDQTGAKSVEAVVSDTVTVKRILPNIITKMNLPVIGPDGRPMSYSLDHKEGGKRLHEDQTLVQAAVNEGDHLIVYPEIVAG
ncbi:MAG TPA: EsaB/YukD family protein [Pirellulaceae bacterium]|nr:EsaB/YukD family protein [Pirellulaceae bacterium]HMO92334.1 EsaB/YukD family protein [Pirellulaceae bacterium]HMP69258.1 EsaB/YukD family protein [Pirellulaceae bacterium]